MENISNGQGGEAQAPAPDILSGGIRVRLPDGSRAQVRAREVGGATYALTIDGTVSRGWTRDQLVVEPVADAWSSIGAVATVDHNRRVSAEGHRATMEMMTRTGGRL